MCGLPVCLLRLFFLAGWFSNALLAASNCRITDSVIPASSVDCASTGEDKDKTINGTDKALRKSVADRNRRLKPSVRRTTRNIRKTQTTAVHVISYRDGSCSRGKRWNYVVDSWLEEFCFTMAVWTQFGSYATVDIQILQSTQFMLDLLGYTQNETILGKDVTITSKTTEEALLNKKKKKKKKSWRYIFFNTNNFFL